MFIENKLLITLNVLATISCIALAIKLIFLPIIVKKIYADEYKQKMFECDNVMRDHMIAKNRVFHEKSKKAIKALEAAEIGLISCHEYDKLRKKMIAWGLTKDDLAYIGIEAIEEKSYDLIKYVEIHEFKY